MQHFNADFPFCQLGNDEDEYSVIFRQIYPVNIGTKYLFYIRQCN